MVCVRLFNWFLQILSRTLRESRELAKFSMLVLYNNCGCGLNKLLSNSGGRLMAENEGFLWNERKFEFLSN